MTDKDFTCIDVTTAKHGYEVFVNMYWLCKDGDPKQALFYKGIYPQCNRNIKVIEYSVNNYKLGFSVTPVFMETAFIKRTT